jgi:hypothetical protein
MWLVPQTLPWNGNAHSLYIKMNPIDADSDGSKSNYQQCTFLFPKKVSILREVKVLTDSLKTRV